jgi:hypothetical protein
MDYARARRRLTTLSNKRSDAVASACFEALEGRRLFSIAPLTGSGVAVAQVEANAGTNAFEVNPSAVNQPASLFTYISTSGRVSGVAPANAAGNESGHADAVGNIFYGGAGAGIAPGISSVDNYSASYFLNYVAKTGTQPSIRAKVVNQSFVTGNAQGQPAEDASIDASYDNYVARYGTIFVSGAGNSGGPDSPSTAYNSISVGVSDAPASVGPTLNGRSKPDISAPGGASSYSTPRVSGAAALLVQAGNRGDGGIGTASAATDARTVKALLLNGANKPADWTHTQTSPLDHRYGAGIVDANNSAQELAAGEYKYSATTTTSSLGGSHLPPAGAVAVEPSLTGWDLRTINSGSRSDAVNHYVFSVGKSGGPTSALTATLTWERQLSRSSINNLDLYLYNTSTGALVAQSISGVDNVEHLSTAGLAPGTYDIEVLKHGGTAGVSAGDVSNSETYALAFNFVQAQQPTSATFVGIDSTTQGNWIGTYGSQGYSLAGDATSLPSSATFSTNGTDTYVWTSSTTETRALQKASGTDRIAASWYTGATNTFTMDLNLTDGQTHRASFYALDYDWHGTRTQQFDLIDAATGNVLDSRTISSYEQGQYVSWNVSGHVLIRVTNVGSSNAVVSGMFLDAAA